MPTYRVVHFDEDGQRVQKDFKTVEAMLEVFEQVGVEEDSYTLRLHGEPVLRGMIGPLSEGKQIIRYEAPQIFVRETEEWAKQRKPKD